MQFIIQFPSIIRHGLLPPSDHSQSVLRSSSLTTGEVNDRRTYRGCDIMDANEHFPSSTVSQPFRAKPAGKLKQTWSASSTIRRIKLKPQTAVSGVPSSENCQRRSSLQHKATKPNHYTLTSIVQRTYWLKWCWWVRLRLWVTLTMSFPGSWNIKFAIRRNHKDSPSK